MLHSMRFICSTLMEICKHGAQRHAWACLLLPKKKQSSLNVQQASKGSGLCLIVTHTAAAGVGRVRDGSVAVTWPFLGRPRREKTLPCLWPLFCTTGEVRCTGLGLKAAAEAFCTGTPKPASMTDVTDDDVVSALGLRA